MNFSCFYFRENWRTTDSSFLVLESGAYGHMLHPFEDDSITFSQIKDIISKLFSGEIKIREKVDGQQLSVSFKNDKVVFARNKEHLRNFGENALDVDSLSQMFNGRGEVQNVFVKSARDLEFALLRKPKSILSKWFGDGSKFLSLEIVYSSTVNVIPYQSNMLIPHSLIEYDENGNVVSSDDLMGKYIFDNINGDYFETFSKMILGNIEIINDLSDEFIREVDRIKGDLHDDTTIKEYRRLKGSVEPIERLFRLLGITLINNSENLLNSNKEDIVNNIRNRIEDKIREIENSDNVDDVMKLKDQLNKFYSIGGADTINPSEGLVFDYNGKKYKLTGSFTYVNNILGIGKYR